MQNRKITVAVTGASGAIYAQAVLRKLGEMTAQFSECALIFSTTALEIWKSEIGDFPDFEYPFKLYDNASFYAPFASGSSQYESMIIVPASAGTVGRIAAGVSSDLILRTADVMLKERRKLIIVPREMPYSLIHLRNMTSLTEAGAVICPASPSFYHKPASIPELADTVAERILDLAGFRQDAKRWMNA